MIFKRNQKSQSDTPVDQPRGRKARKDKIRQVKEAEALLNPHGDGTLHRGDALLDTLTGGQANSAKRRRDGTWEVEILPHDKK